MAYSTPGQTRNRIYRFMRQRLLEGDPPTVREVQQAFGMRAVQSAKSHLNALVKEGLLIQEPGRARGYRLPVQSASMRLAPVVGNVSAGPFNLAVEDIEGYMPVHSRLAEGSIFALRVRGESMQDAGILPGDIVVVRRQVEIRSGDIIVALVDDEATIKEYYRTSGDVELRPRNSEYPILTVHPEHLTVVGKVVEVRRFLESENLLKEEVSA